MEPVLSALKHFQNLSRALRQALMSPPERDLLTIAGFIKYRPHKLLSALWPAPNPQFKWIFPVRGFQSQEEASSADPQDTPSPRFPLLRHPSLPLPSRALSTHFERLEEPRQRAGEATSPLSLECLAAGKAPPPPTGR